MSLLYRVLVLIKIKNNDAIYEIWKYVKHSALPGPLSWHVQDF